MSFSWIWSNCKYCKQMECSNTPFSAQEQLLEWWVKGLVIILLVEGSDFGEIWKYKKVLCLT